jgi:pentatricopeptide repeat protein
MVPPNTVIYNILIDALRKNNNVERAVSLMDDMKVKGVRPNTTTYNAVLKGVRDNRMLDKGFELMDMMVEDACNPDYVTMEILTEWLSAIGEIEKLKLFVEGYQVSSNPSSLQT